MHDSERSDCWVLGLLFLTFGFGDLGFRASGRSKAAGIDSFEADCRPRGPHSGDGRSRLVGAAESRGAGGVAKPCFLGFFFHFAGLNVPSTTHATHKNPSTEAVREAETASAAPSAATMAEEAPERASEHKFGGCLLCGMENDIPQVALLVAEKMALREQVQRSPAEPGCSDGSEGSEGSRVPDCAELSRWADRALDMLGFLLSFGKGEQSTCSSG